MKVMEMYLPLNAAIVKEAKQNFERDARCRLIGKNSRSKNMSMYLEEAAVLFKLADHGYYPEYPDHYLIKLA